MCKNDSMNNNLNFACQQISEKNLASHTLIRILFSAAPFGSDIPSYININNYLFGEGNGKLTGNCDGKENSCAVCGGLACQSCLDFGHCTSQNTSSNYINISSGTINAVLRCSSAGSLTSPYCTEMGLKRVKINLIDSYVPTGGFAISNLKIKPTFKANSLYPSENIMDFVVCIKSQIAINNSASFS